MALRHTDLVLVRDCSKAPRSRCLYWRHALLLAASGTHECLGGASACQAVRGTVGIQLVGFPDTASVLDLPLRSSGYSLGICVAQHSAIQPELRFAVRGGNRIASARTDPNVPACAGPVARPLRNAVLGECDVCCRRAGCQPRADSTFLLLGESIRSG